MFTYQMKIRNKDDWRKIVYVSAMDFHKAVRQVKEIYGNEWFVYESRITNAR